MGPGQLSQVMAQVSKCALSFSSICSYSYFCRDPTKHSTLKEEIEEQSTAMYASARLWDDGIIKPVDTRDTVGLALALSSRERKMPGSGGLTSTTWDGDKKGFGVFRM